MGCNTSQEQSQVGPNVNKDETDENDSQNNENNKKDNELITMNNEKTNLNHNNSNKGKIKTSKSNSNEIIENGPKNQTNCDQKLKSKDTCINNDPNLDEGEEKAATKIQAVFRGHQVRTTMKQGDNITPNPPVTINKNESTSAKGGGGSSGGGTTPVITTNDKTEEMEYTKEQLEAEFDPNDKDLCNAATRIQATFRGHLQRKIATKEDVDIQEITKKVAEELDIDLTDPELNKAATKIQASFRGHKTRKDGGTAN